MIRESYEPVSSKTEAGGIRREEVEGDVMTTVITIVIDTGDETITKEVTVRGCVTNDNLAISTRTVSVPTTTKNPLHPDALTLSDLREGMNVRMHYTGGEPHIESFSAVIAETFENENGNMVVAYYRVRTDARPFSYGYKERLARSLGLCPYDWKHPSTWLLDWYVTAE